MDLSKLTSLSDDDKLALTGMIAENSAQIDARWKVKLDESIANLDASKVTNSELTESLKAAKDDLSNSDVDAAIKRQLADVTAKHDDLTANHAELEKNYEKVQGDFMNQKFNSAFNSEAEAFNTANEATGIKSGANQYLLPDARNNFKLSDSGTLEAVNAQGEPIGGVTVSSWLEEKRKDNSFFFNKPKDTGAKDGAGGSKETITQEELNALPLAERYEAATTKQLV